MRIPQITGIMPDETKDSGWIRAGLAPLFAYLDRKNMLESFKKESGDPLEKIVLPVKYSILDGGFLEGQLLPVCVGNPAGLRHTITALSS